MTDTPTTPRWRLVDDWYWIVNHAWSMRLMVLAFILSGAEVGVQVFASKHEGDPLFAALVALLTGAAFVARLFAQDRDA